MCAFLGHPVLVLYIKSIFEQSCVIGYNFVTEHLGEFPTVSYLKVKDSTKSLVTFLVLVRGIFFLYHLKAYVYSFILSHDSKFLGSPFMA